MEVVLGGLIAICCIKSVIYFVPSYPASVSVWCHIGICREMVSIMRGSWDSETLCELDAAYRFSHILLIL